MSVILAGSTGTIGAAVARQLRLDGIDVWCPTRARGCDLTQPGQLSAALAGRRVEAVISCMATRTGAPSDAWDVEYHAQCNLLAEAAEAGARHFVLLSAICVQKPKLAFQHAKLAFESALTQSGLTYSIVRPTAYFKSLSGQVARVQDGTPFLMFGDGRMTACKPISDRDLATYLVDCLIDSGRRNRVLPIGGPGPAITPKDQAQRLFSMLDVPPRIRHVPIGLMRGIAGGLGLASAVAPALRPKAEFARTGLYYATESMLHWDAAAGRYDAAATPEFGSDTLWDHYADLVAGRVHTDLGAHAVF